MPSPRHESKNHAEPTPASSRVAEETCPAQAQWRAMQSRYSGLRNVVCEDTGAAIRLGGRVSSHYLKQLALSVVCQVAGTRPILNEIRVEPTAPRRRPAAAPVPAPHRHGTVPSPVGFAPAWWRKGPGQPKTSRHEVTRRDAEDA